MSADKRDIVRIPGSSMGKTTDSLTDIAQSRLREAVAAACARSAAQVFEYVMSDEYERDALEWEKVKERFIGPPGSNAPIWRLDSEGDE